MVGVTPIDWCLTIILVGFIIGFSLLFSLDYLINLYKRHLNWVIPYTIIFGCFATMIYLLFPSISKMAIGLICVLIILYEFRETYRSKYLKHFKEVPVRKKEKQLYES